MVDIQEDQGTELQLPPAQGGKMLPVQLGPQENSSKLPQLGHAEAIQWGSSQHLSGAQQTGLVAGLRAKLGRKIVEPGLQQAMVNQNSCLEEFFTEKEMQFFNTDGTIALKHLFHSFNTVGLIKKVKELRGLEEETEIVLQGDTWQNYLKIGINIIRVSQLKGGQVEEGEGTGLVKPGPSTSKNKRRTRAEGIYGGSQFKDWGARRMLLLAVVHKVPESHQNLRIIFDAIGLDKFPFKMTGDFAFQMPVYGLVKGCSGTSPCPLCDQLRTKVGGSVPRWVGVPRLRTLGDQYKNFAGWIKDGEKQSASATAKWKGVCGSPLLPVCQGRSQDNELLALTVPGPLHLFLSFNEILNFLEKKRWPARGERGAEAGCQDHLPQLPGEGWKPGGQQHPQDLPQPGQARALHAGRL